ncbi:MAG TPA: peptidoglycan DD-metalloendopeptidase family protein [Puia sp.]|uniref:murein hydrolase activator EnvC family protein n=1 Tax=Puia sp. TaxID=2045100 RepID=UPI002BE7B55D|nr:peptidoglycan DD-metalloendopeptidase family protein [Puia sp.]HVU97715.1 peptidoglycan DD-metalloendopeptidase family protein [Puia sp.]
MRKKLIFATLCLLAVGRLVAQQPAVQNRADLEKERAAIQKEIEDVKRTLDETHSHKRETLGQLALLQRRLKLRESAIRNINQQLDAIQGDMNQSWREILKLRAELDTLRVQYAQSIVFAYKNRSSYDLLNFVFSAGNFNDAIRRIQYLKSYRAYREERAENIRRTQDLLQGKIDGLKVTRAAKEDAMKKQSRERALLEDEKREKDQVVNRLQSQEKELKKEMAAKQRQDARLGSAINAAIRRATDLARKEAAKRSADEKAAAARAAAAEKANAAKAGRPETSDEALAPATLNTVKTPGKTVFSSEADVHLTGDFENNRLRLPWPVSGTISMSFGRHEYIKGIWHDNAGITIDVQPGAAVKSVFKGEVQSVFSVGDVQAVMIRHGRYFTTYSNLSTVSVAKGEPVVTGQIIGRVGEVGQLEFVLSNEKGTNLDPERWLKR